MAPRISLALTLHNHQPVGNFGWVFEEVFERAYEPMVGALERHPAIHLGLHYSGPLLEWIVAERATFLDRLRALVGSGQVEILGGGLYEPVLAALPERDRVGQLTRMADVVSRRFGVRPTGAWLAERVWEPALPTSLAAAGYGWTILDDAHFRAAAIPEDEMWGPYITDDQGQTLTVFGTEQGLRYRVPFGEVDSVIAYLREHATEAGDRLGTMGDDGEKFGAWPETWEHCWGTGRWVDRFFEAIEANAGWLAAVRPSDWLASHAPAGRVAIPTSSYAEMGEWALPAGEALAFEAAFARARQTNAPDARWLRGGFWRNFQIRYREINDLHKQMLRVSAKVDRLPAGPTREAALDHLYRGQSNDTYWHGLFGGIYIPHMRAASFGELIRAEAAADLELGSLDAAEALDLDLDGRDEIRLAAAGQVVTVDLDEGAGIGSWDIRAAGFPLGAVLRRRPEAYHEKLRRLGAGGAAAATAADAHGRAADDAAVASIHDVVRMKEPDLATRLVYDGYERRAGLLRVMPSTSTALDWRAGGGPDLGDFVAGAFVVDRLDADGLVAHRDGVVTGAGSPIEVRLTKTIRLGGGRLDPGLRVELELEHRAGPGLRARLGIEWPTMLLGGGSNPQAWWQVGESRTAHDGSGTAADVGELRQGNDWLGLVVRTSVEPAAEAWWAPIETVSNSEAGFERVYQGSALLLSWVVELEAGGRWRATVEQAVSVEPG